MKILVACEESGRVRDAFIAKGHKAVSLDLLPTSSWGPHRQEFLTPGVLAEGWDMVIGFPPCTYLSNIGAQYWKRWQADGRQAEAFAFVKMIWAAPVGKVVIENPAGWLNSNWMKPSQIVNPWQFGDPYIKRTCLWTRGLAPLVPLITDKPADARPWIGGQRSVLLSDGSRSVKDHPAWAKKCGRACQSVIRSKTFPGIANAMAEAWG